MSAAFTPVLTPRPFIRTSVIGTPALETAVVSKETLAAMGKRIVADSYR